MIQICPFAYDQTKEDISLLVQGLADSAFIYFDLAKIPTAACSALQVNFESLDLQQFTEPFDLTLDNYYFSCKVARKENIFSVTMLIFADQAAKNLLYCDMFDVPERNLMSVWEEKFKQLLVIFADQKTGAAKRNVHFTTSYEAFSEFCQAIQLMEESENSKIFEGYEHFLTATVYDNSFVEAAHVAMFFISQRLSSLNLENIIDILNKMNVNVGGDANIQLFLAEIYQKLRNNSKACEILENVVEQHSQNSDGFVQLALLYNSLGKKDEAEKILRRRLEIDENDVSCLDILGAIYAGADKYEKAEKLWLKTFKLAPERINVLCNLGLLAEESGNLEKAEALYLKTLDIAEYWCAYYNFGAFCQRRKRFQESMRLLKSAVTLMPEHLPSLIALSEVYLKLGYFAKAQEMLLKVLQFSNENSLRCYALSLLDKMDSNPEALWETKIQKNRQKWQSGHKFKAIIGLLMQVSCRGSHDYWYLWSEIFDSCGMHAMSLYFLKKAKGIDYNTVHRLGFYYYNKGHLKTARLYLDVAYSLDNSDKEVNEIYFNSLVQLGEIDEYERLTQHIVAVRKYQEELMEQFEIAEESDLADDCEADSQQMAETIETIVN